MKAAFGHFARKSWDLRGVRSGHYQRTTTTVPVLRGLLEHAERLEAVLFTSQLSRVVGLDTTSAEFSLRAHAKRL